MYKFILIAFIFSFGYVSALTEEEEADILVLHEQNLVLVDSFIDTNQNIIRSFLGEGGRCNDTDTSYIKGLRIFSDYAKNTPFTQELDYETDKEYIENIERKELLEEKKDILENGGILTQTHTLSDGTLFTEEITVDEGIYDEEIEELLALNKEIVNEYRLRHIKERGKNNELQDYLAVGLINKCIEIREQIEATDEILYKKLEQLESENPGVLNILLPELRKIKNEERYKKYSRVIWTIISYIENR